MAETSYNLTNIVKVTQDQYTTLKNGGTIGSHTYDSSILYLVQDNPSYTVRRVTSADKFNGLVSEIFYFCEEDGESRLYMIDISDSTIDRIDIGYLKENDSIAEIDIPSINGITNYEEFVRLIDSTIENTSNPYINYVTSTYVDNAIAAAITNTLNGSY